MTACLFAMFQRRNYGSIVTPDLQNNYNGHKSLAGGKYCRLVKDFQMIRLRNSGIG